MCSRLVLGACMVLGYTEQSLAGVPPPFELDAETLIERAFIGSEDSAKMSIAPDGSAIAFAISKDVVQNNTHTISWKILELGEKPELLTVDSAGELVLNYSAGEVTSNGSEVTSRIRWSPDSNWILYANKRDGKIGLWLASRDGRVLELVSSPDYEVLGSFEEAFFEWSADGRRIYYEVGWPLTLIERQKSSEAARGFIYDARFSPEFSNLPFWPNCSGTLDVPARSLEICEPSVRIFAVDSGIERAANEVEHEEYFRLKKSRMSRESKSRETKTVDGFRISLRVEKPTENLGANPPRRVAIQEESGSFIPCRQEVCVSQFLDNIWEANGKIVFQRQEGSVNKEVRYGYSVFYEWDSSKDSVREIHRSLSSFTDCVPVKEQLVCLEESATRPRRISAISLATGQVNELYDPNPHISADLFSRYEYLEFEDNYGRTASAKLIWPHDYDPDYAYPMVIVQQYGRHGFYDGGQSDEYPVHLYAQAGFFVLVMDRGYYTAELRARLRGLDIVNSGGDTYLEAELGVELMEDAIALLRQRGFIDENRVGATGFSALSTNVRYALINRPGMIAAASVNQGYSGPQRIWFRSRPQERKYFYDTYFGGKPPFGNHVEEFLRPITLGYHARKLVFPPYLMQISDKEASQAYFDYALLEDEGHPVEMYIFENDEHEKYQPAHKLSVFRRNVQWMQFWLNGVVDDSPVDPNQYSRWKQLCGDYVLNLANSAWRKDHARSDQQFCTRATKNQAVAEDSTNK